MLSLGLVELQADEQKTDRDGHTAEHRQTDRQTERQTKSRGGREWWTILTDGGDWTWT